jgi:hypothetical protein
LRLDLVEAVSELRFVPQHSDAVDRGSRKRSVDTANVLVGPRQRSSSTLRRGGRQFEIVARRLTITPARGCLPIWSVASPRCCPVYSGTGRRDWTDPRNVLGIRRTLVTMVGFVSRSKGFRLRDSSRYPTSGGSVLRSCLVPRRGWVRTFAAGLQSNLQGTDSRVDPL